MRRGRLGSTFCFLMGIFHSPQNDAGELGKEIKILNRSTAYVSLIISFPTGFSQQTLQTAQVVPG